MTKEELDKVEAIVNEKIEENLPVLTKGHADRGSEKDRRDGSVW